MEQKPLGEYGLEKRNFALVCRKPAALCDRGRDWSEISEDGGWQIHAGQFCRQHILEFWWRRKGKNLDEFPQKALAWNVIFFFLNYLFFGCAGLFSSCDLQALVVVPRLIAAASLVAENGL